MDSDLDQVSGTKRRKHHYKFIERTHSGTYYKFYCDSHLGHLDGPYKFILVKDFWGKALKMDSKS